MEGDRYYAIKGGYIGKDGVPDVYPILRVRGSEMREVTGLLGTGRWSRNFGVKLTAGDIPALSSSSGHILEEIREAEAEIVLKKLKERN